MTLPRCSRHLEPCASCLPRKWRPIVCKRMTKAEWVGNKTIGNILECLTEVDSYIVKV